MDSAATLRAASYPRPGISRSMERPSERDEYNNLGPSFVPTASRQIRPQPATAAADQALVGRAVTEHYASSHPALRLAVPIPSSGPAPPAVAHAGADLQRSRSPHTVTTGTARPTYMPAGSSASGAPQQGRSSREGSHDTRQALPRQDFSKAGSASTLVYRSRSSSLAPPQPIRRDALPMHERPQISSSSSLRTTEQKRLLDSKQRAGLASAIRSLQRPLSEDVQRFSRRYEREQPEYAKGSYISMRRIRQDGSWRNSLIQMEPAIVPVRILKHAGCARLGMQVGRVRAYHRYLVEVCGQPAVRMEAWDVELGELAELRQPDGPGILRQAPAKPSVLTFTTPRPQTNSSSSAIASRSGSNSSVSSRPAVSASVLLPHSVAPVSSTPRPAIQPQPVRRPSVLLDADEPAKQRAQSTEPSSSARRLAPPPPLTLKRSNHQAFPTRRQPLSPLSSLSSVSSSPRVYSLAPATPGRRYAKRKASADISQLLAEQHLLKRMRKRRATFLLSAVRHNVPESPLKVPGPPLSSVKRRVGPALGSPLATPRSARLPHSPRSIRSPRPPRTPQSATGRPEASIPVPVKSAAQTDEAAVESTLQQRTPDIVVDDMAID